MFANILGAMEYYARERWVTLNIDLGATAGENYFGNACAGASLRAQDTRNDWICVQDMHTGSSGWLQSSQAADATVAIVEEGYCVEVSGYLHLRKGEVVTVLYAAKPGKGDDGWIWGTKDGSKVHKVGYV